MTKDEIRMSKESQMPRMQMTKWGPREAMRPRSGLIRHSSFGFLSTFDFRHSTFPPPRWCNFFYGFLRLPNRLAKRMP